MRRLEVLLREPQVGSILDAALDGLGLVEGAMVLHERPIVEDGRPRQKLPCRIFPHVFLGSKFEAMDVELLRRHGITAVLNMAAGTLRAVRLAAPSAVASASAAPAGSSSATHPSDRRGVV